MPESIDILVILWCAFALACGGFIKGALGVGTPLLTVPMMAQVLPPQVAIAIMAVPVVLANTVQFVQAERSVEVAKHFWPAFLAILVGTWIGVSILARIEETRLLIIVGITVIVFAFLQGSQYRMHLPDHLVKPFGLLFGGASGLIGGLSSFFGPMLILYLISIRGLSKNQFVNSISFLYISAVVPWAVMLYVVGMLDNQLLLISVVAAIPVSLGLALGQRLRGRISDDRFRYLVLAILFISGGSMLWRAWQLG